MAQVKSPEPVYLFVGVILGECGLLDELESALAGRIGPVEARSPVFDFDVTAYYEEEMGADLKRVFFAFKDLVDPADIVDVKLTTNEIEEEFSEGGKRRVNIDPGYMDFYKLVLASNKFLGQKIYLGKGVYADPTLYYDKRWKPYEWGFPDFKGGRYDAFLTQMRKTYKSKIRPQKGGHIAFFA